MDDVDLAPTRLKLDVHAFHQMAEAGLFGDNRRIELIGGELIDMAPISHEHAVTTNALNHALVIAVGGKAIVAVANPLRLNELDEPQPDFTIFRPRADFYAGERPGPKDVLLVVEVAKTSLHYDRTVKLPMYARAGIGEYWIVDLRRGIVDAYRSPVGDAYADKIMHRRGDRVALTLAPDIIVTLDLMFG